MPENRPAHTVKDMTPGMSGYITPSAIRIDAKGGHWLDPNAPVIVHRVMIQACGEPPTAIKLMRRDEGYLFTCRYEGMEFEKADNAELKSFVPVTIVV